MVEEEKAPTQSVGAGEGPSPKKPNRKKGWIAAGVAVAVVAVAGVSFAVWHEQPSFCSAVCHTPMDAYLPTYEAELHQSATDKWGNEVSNASAMLAPVHRAQGKTNCMGCHVPSLSEQIGEGAAWAAGNYEAWGTADGRQVVPERTLAKLTQARGVTSEEFCLNESCHDMDLRQLAMETADMQRNPHAVPRDDNHSLKFECGDCHKAHRASVNECSTCHSDADIPDGWLSAVDAGKMMKAMA